MRGVLLEVMGLRAEFEWFCSASRVVMQGVDVLGDEEAGAAVWIGAAGPPVAFPRGQHLMGFIRPRLSEVIVEDLSDHRPCLLVVGTIKSTASVHLSAKLGIAMGKNLADQQRTGGSARNGRCGLSPGRPGTKAWRGTWLESGRERILSMTGMISVCYCGPDRHAGLPRFSPSGLAAQAATMLPTPINTFDIVASLFRAMISIAIQLDCCSWHEFLINPCARILLKQGRLL